jgi:hypothetical protein
MYHTMPLGYCKPCNFRKCEHQGHKIETVRNPQKLTIEQKEGNKVMTEHKYYSEDYFKI